MLKTTEIETGRIVKFGDTVTSTRGDTGTLTYVSRANEAGRDGKVFVDGREYYARVWGLAVEEVPEVQP